MANPDLGVISWHKQFNIIDFGRLGSPIMAKLSSDAALADYFFDVASPDFIEFHFSYFSCDDRKILFADPRFAAQYGPLVEKSENWPDCGPEPMPNGIWIRKDVLADAHTRERALIDRLEAALQAPIPAVREWLAAGTEAKTAMPVAGTGDVMDAIDVLEQEIEICRAQVGACFYIARTAYRFLPEFRAAGAMAELIRGIRS